MSGIAVLVLDVDGVLTDGGIRLDGHGEASKRFHVHDGCMIQLWQRQGGRAAILSGRESAAVLRRAEELGIAVVRHAAGPKLPAYVELLTVLGARETQVCYVGDDLPDLGPMRRCGFPVAVANAVPAVKRVAEFVTSRRGGEGAVGEVIELILRKQRRWSPALGEPT